MNRIDDLLYRIENVKKTGDNQWMGKCPAHVDDTASLAISISGEKILLHCHAGCEVAEILQALNLEMTDLFLDSGISKPVGIESEYNYTDANGVVLFQVVRSYGKGFKQRKPDGFGGYEWGVQGVQKVLYRLQELVNSHGIVYIVEGEKDADNLMAHELIATTNSGGAGKWMAAYSESLRGRDVVILPDNDDAGRKHAAIVASSLHGIAQSVKIVELKGLKEKGDVSDYLAGNSLVDMLQEIEEYEVGVSKSTNHDVIQLTDLGNVMYFVEVHGEDIRYSFESKKWLIWNGSYWEKDSAGKIFYLIKDAIRTMYKEAGDSGSGVINKDLARHALRSQSLRAMKAIEELSRSEPSIHVTTDECDSDLMKLNVLNGELDLRTGQLLPHNRESMITKMTNVSYDVDATAPIFEEFIKTIMEGNEETISYVQRAIGYSLTGDTSERALFMLHGTGKNGKSTLLEVMQLLLADYATRTPTKTLLASSSNGVPNDIARLCGQRFVSASESDEGQHLCSATIKDITGGDTISARFLFSEWFDYRPQFKIWFSTNEKPVVKANDQALWDRMKLIPFTYRVPDDLQDKHLGQKLATELPGILNFAIQGCLDWQQVGLNAPEVVSSATNSYRNECDTLGDFFEDACNLGAAETCTAKDLFEAYNKWCENNGEKPENKRSFGTKLNEHAEFSQYRTMDARCWAGIGLKTFDEKEDARNYA